MKAVSFNVSGASIDWLKLMPLTCTDGRVDSDLSIKKMNSCLTLAGNYYFACGFLLPKFFVVFIRVGGEELSGVDGDGDGAARVGSLVEPVLFFLLSEAFVFLADLLRSLGPLNHLPALRLEPFGAQVVVDGPFVRIAQHLVGSFRLVEQHLRFLFTKRVRVLVGMIDATEAPVRIGDVFLRCLQMCKENVSKDRREGSAGWVECTFRGRLRNWYRSSSSWSSSTSMDVDILL